MHGMIWWMYNARQKQSNLPEWLRTLLITATWVILVGAPVGFIVYAGFFQEAPEVTATIDTLETVEAQNVSVDWPSQGIAAIGGEGYGVLAASEGAQDPVPIASISKLFLALAIMEERPFELGEDGPTIAITQADEDLYNDYISRGGSAYPVNTGQTYTQYQAMQALLIPSANNMADTLVNWAFGSQQEYLDYVNQMVLDMGLENTVLADASGFSPDSISTPAELVLAGQAALENPVIADIVMQSQAAIYPGVEPVFSTNQLLGTPGVIGIKTGTTDEAGANVLFGAQHSLTETSETVIVGVVMGQPDREVLYEEAQALLASAYQGYDFIQVLEEEAVVGEYKAPWMTEGVPIVSAGGAVVPAWVGRDITPVAEVEDIKPGNVPGEQIGTAVIDHGVETTAVPLVTQGSIPEPSFWWKVTNFFSR